MAAKILKGRRKSKRYEFETFNNGDVIINTAAAKKINMTNQQRCAETGKTDI